MAPCAGKRPRRDSAEDRHGFLHQDGIPAGLTAVHFLRLKLSRQGETVSENFYWRGLEDGDYRALRTLAQANVGAATRMEQRDGRWRLSTELHNVSATPALMVCVKAVREKTGDRILPALYSDNYVALMPGESRTSSSIGRCRYARRETERGCGRLQRGGTVRRHRRTRSRRDIPLDGDVSGVLPRLRHVVGELHAQKVVMSGPNAFSMRRGHLRRQRGLAVKKVGERGAAHFQNLRCLRHVEAEGFDDLGLDQVARMGGFFMSIAGLLMVIDQIDIAGGVRRFVEAKINRQFPVTVRLQNPFRSPLSGCSFQPGNRPSWSRVRGFEGEQKLAHLVRHRGRHSLAFPSSWSCLNPCCESGQVACHLFMISVCTVAPYTSSVLSRGKSPLSTRGKIDQCPAPRPRSTFRAGLCARCHSARTGGAAEAARIDRKRPRASWQVAPEQASSAPAGARDRRWQSSRSRIFMGYSSAWIALGLRPGGRLIVCDVSEEYARIARRTWRDRRRGGSNRAAAAPALDSLDALIDEGHTGSFDFIFIDADKGNYIHYYERALPLLRQGGLIAADNVLFHGTVADPRTTMPTPRPSASSTATCNPTGASRSAWPPWATAWLWR